MIYLSLFAQSFIFFSKFFYILTIIFQPFLEAADFRRKAQAVQREMPRPCDVNTTVLRPKEIKADLNPLQLVMT